MIAAACSSVTIPVHRHWPTLLLSESTARLLPSKAIA